LAEYPHRELVTSLAQGPAVLESLLEAFPDRRIIFRPHPSDLRLHELNRQDTHSEVFGRMLEICRTRARCELDDNATSYLDSYRRSAVLVSDTSSTAFTFALSTGRPVVFLSPREEEMNAELGRHLKFVNDRQQIGMVTTTVEEMTTAVDTTLQEDRAEDLRRFRDSMIFNAGRAADYFTENVDCFLTGEKHPDWLYLNW
jgi:CDP-glycerol glycerophosphotransferase (TagB/SpsB family)